MSRRRLAALVGAVLTVGAALGTVWGLLTMADLIDRAEHELGS